MNETEVPIHLFLAAGIFSMDLIVAALLFVILKRREHPLTYVIPSFIVIAGLFSAVLVYFNMNPGAN